jgi:hypothetical protein
MQNYNLPSVNTGNTFYGVRFVLPANPLYSLDGAKVKMMVKTKPDAQPVASFSSDDVDGKIVIIDDRTLEISQHEIALLPNNYQYDILFEFADGRKSTLIGGGWIINKVITE